MDIKHIKDELKRKKEYIAAKVVVSRYNSIYKNYKEAVNQVKEAENELQKYKNVKNSLSKKRLSHRERKKLNEKLQNNDINYAAKLQAVRQREMELKTKLDSLTTEYEQAIAFVEENKEIQKDIYYLSNLDYYIKRNYVAPNSNKSKRKPLDSTLSYEVAYFVSPLTWEDDEWDDNESYDLRKVPDENIGDYIKNNLEEDFFELLSSYMDRCIKNKIYKSEVDIYKKAGCSRQQFHKMKNDPSYKPNKHTVLSYSVVCHLNHDETLKLLSTTGYTLSNSSKYDLIVNYYIKNGIYDFEFINECLYQYGYEKESELFLGSS